MSADWMPPYRHRGAFVRSNRYGIHRFSYPLDGARGTAFDRMWLQMMIRHHEGAIAMANTELDNGTNADAIRLARSIVASQSAEILRMKKLEAALR